MKLGASKPGNEMPAVNDSKGVVEIEIGFGIIGVCVKEVNQHSF